MEEKGAQQKPHAIMFPYPYQGHIIPFVHLAMKLAAEGFTITFVNTEFIHHQISQASSKLQEEKGDDDNNDDDDIFTEARRSGLDIRYETVSDGFPLGFDRSLNHDQFVEGLLHVFSAHVDELIGKIIISDEPPVTCLIADTFFVWSSMIACKYNLVNVSFWTEPALVLTLYYHLDLLIKHGHFASIDNREDTIDYIPGVAAIDPKDLMSYLQSPDIFTVVHRVIYKAIFQDVKRADFIVCNTIQELESNTLSALNQKQPVYAIGPIIRSGLTPGLVSISLWSESDCTKWLNTKPDGSVLYASFGSYAHTSKRDILEIGYGLALSGVTFVWVLRPDIVSSDDTDFLPLGFKDEIRDRGLIVTWCRQIEVISHPAIGGFLTHCGWNSTLESICCSVPLLCFPLLTDQITNRKLVVDDWNIGINLCESKSSITRSEVAEKIKVLMSLETSDEMRRKMKEVRKTVENAMGPNGSSQKNLAQFINGVKSEIVEREGYGGRLRDQQSLKSIGL